MTRIAYVSTYLPQKCGIATYTHHLRKSVRGAKGWIGFDPVFAVKPAGNSFDYLDPAITVWEKENRSGYGKLAERINRSDIDVVSLQHEFGIYGGEAGEYVLDFADQLEKPLAVTFHTVFKKPEEPYRRIQERLSRRADLILVMNRKAVQYLRQSFGINDEKIRCVPHGTPEPASEKRELYRNRLGWSGRKIVLSFGLLSRGKGFETVIRAMPDVVRKVPEALYVIAGQTHPEVKKREGEAYRNQLQELIRTLGLHSHVEMLDRYMEEDELTGILSACDLYVTPYPGLQQITSGTLAYAVGLGRPVLSTPYSYAKDVLAGDPELLIAPGNVQRWAEGITGILADDKKRRQVGRRVGKIGSSMHWPKVGKQHLELFRSLAANHQLMGMTR